MRFSTPGWLVVGAVACALLYFAYRVTDAKQRAALARFISAHLHAELTRSISLPRRRIQRLLFAAAVALLCVALAGPQWGYHWEQISRRGNEIVFALDTSRSMNTPDIKPNRLARAKLAIDDFADRLDGDAVGIVAFAGSAFLICPITLDYGAFHETLAAIDTNTVPRGGTNITSAIQEAQAALRRRPGSDKILILVTDGEDLEGSAVSAAQAAKQSDGLTIFTVGVGTGNGDLIPVPPEQGGGFVKDENGQFVKSKLDVSALQAIAAATGGFYVPLGSQGEGLDLISKNVLGPLHKHELASRQQKIYNERYQWPLGAALLALLASLMMGTRRRLRTPARAADDDGSNVDSNVDSSIATVALAAAVALAGLIPRPAHADAASPVDAYNAGTAAYRAGQFTRAADAFKQSISHAPASDARRLADQEDAYYNLGNALYRAGQKTQAASTKDTLKTWNDAVAAYETALQLRPDDADSKYNRDLVKRKIEELQKPQNQNQNQNQQGKQNSPPQPGQGQGQGQQGQQGQQPGQGQGQPSQGQSQPPGQGQPGQPPPPGQTPGQPPPNSQASPGQPPPPAANNGGQPPPNPPGTDGAQPRKGAGQPTAAPNTDQPPPGSDGEDAARAADNQHLPGQMSREEARELLDSAKGDEHRLTGVAQRDAESPPDKPIKNW